MNEQAAVARELVSKVMRELEIPRFMKATVMSVADAGQFGGLPLINIRVDGDTAGELTPAFNCLGTTPPVGKRVLVVFTPEGGCYALSTLDGSQAGEFPKSLCDDYAGTVTSGGGTSTWTTVVDPLTFSSQATAFVASMFVQVTANGVGTTPNVQATLQLDGIDTSLALGLYDSVTLGAAGYVPMSRTCVVEVPTTSYGVTVVNNSTQDVQFYVSVVLQETDGDPCCLKVGGG